MTTTHPTTVVNIQGLSVPAWDALFEKIKSHASTLGFQNIGCAGADTGQAAEHLATWLASGQHGEMDYMAKHAVLRSDPRALVPDVRSVITVSLPYWQAAGEHEEEALAAEAMISRYARGRDYHKIVRQRLQRLADRIEEALKLMAPDFPWVYRVFSDSAPVMEVEFAVRSGLAWRGKHTLSLSRQGSWYFLGEIYTNLPLPTGEPLEPHCGRCERCIDACPTRAIIAPYQLDARRCISYLTIELKTAIPIEFRPLIGNRIYGCDDCQAVCPWNRFAAAGDPVFASRFRKDQLALVDLFAWDEARFEHELQGSPIRRIGHTRWLRNIAVALGNAPPTDASWAALNARADHASPLVREHVAWALNQAFGSAGDRSSGVKAPLAPRARIEPRSG